MLPPIRVAQTQDWPPDPQPMFRRDSASGALLPRVPLQFRRLARILPMGSLLAGAPSMAPSMAPHESHPKAEPVLLTHHRIRRAITGRILATPTGLSLPALPPLRHAAGPPPCHREATSAAARPASRTVTTLRTVSPFFSFMKHLRQIVSSRGLHGGGH